MWCVRICESDSGSHVCRTGEAGVAKPPALYATAERPKLEQLFDCADARRREREQSERDSADAQESRQ